MEYSEYSELKIFRNIIFWSEMSNNWPNDLWETNPYNTPKFSW